MQRTLGICRTNVYVYIVYANQTVVLRSRKEGVELEGTVRIYLLENRVVVFPPLTHSWVERQRGKKMSPGLRPLRSERSFRMPVKLNLSDWSMFLWNGTSQEGLWKSDANSGQRTVR